MEEIRCIEKKFFALTQKRKLIWNQFSNIDFETEEFNSNKIQQNVLNV